MNPTTARRLLRLDRNVFGEAEDAASDAEVLGILEPGCAVWSKALREGSSELPIGGRIFAIEVTADPDTAETVRFFHVVSTNNGRLSLRRLRDSEIDTRSVQLPDPASVRDTWRMLCREVGTSKGTALAQEGEFMAAAHALYRAVAV